MTNQRFAADDGYVQRTEAPDQSEDPLHQVVAMPFSQIEDGVPVVQMCRFIRVAARTSQPTLLRNFDG